jgi:rhodanese-related sulfurtransferase
MRKRTLVVVLLAVGLLASAAVAAPAILVNNDTYDFGTALEGVFVTHRFVISNIGDEPLQDLQARSTCGCTMTTILTHTLAPGESIDVEVTFDTAGYGGRTVTKQVYVVSNDPVTPTLYLYLLGDVLAMQSFNVAITDMQYLLYVLVDLRSPEDYAERHIIGAVNIPYETFAASMPLLPDGNLIIVYDEDGTRGDEMAQMLIANGYRDAKSLVGGFAMWARQMGTSFLWPLGQ